MLQERNGLEYRWTKKQSSPLDTKSSHVRAKPIRACQAMPKSARPLSVSLQSDWSYPHSTRTWESEVPALDGPRAAVGIGPMWDTVGLNKILWDHLQAMAGPVSPWHFVLEGLQSHTASFTCHLLPHPLPMVVPQHECPCTFREMSLAPLAVSSINQSGCFPR